MLQDPQFFADVKSLPHRLSQSPPWALERTRTSARGIQLQPRPAEPRPLTLTGKLHVPLRTASSSACHWCGRDASGT